MTGSYKPPKIVPSPHFTVDDFSLHQQVLASFHGLNSKFTLYPRTTPIGMPSPAAHPLVPHRYAKITGSQ